MQNFLNDQLSRVLLDIEGDLSSTGLTELAISTFFNSVKEMGFVSIDDFYSQLKSLEDLLLNTKPKIGIVIYFFIEINTKLQEARNNIKTKQDLFDFIDILHKEIQKEFKEDMDNIVKYGSDLISDGDTILIHSPSSTIKNVLKEGKKKGKKFKIILTEQANHKTENIIYFLQQNDINFVTVPEFMLSNIEEKVDKIFAGALTLNSNYKFITSAGLNSIISEFHFAHKKTYIFLSTTKFSLWLSDPKGNSEVVYKLKDIESKDSKIKTYKEMKFSHDRVSTDLFDYIITEKGILDSSKIKELYDELYKKRESLCVI